MRTCDHPNEPMPEQCAVCWHYVHDERYRALLDRIDLVARKILPPPEWDGGPGTELEAIFRTLRIQPKWGCGCGSVARLMDNFGVEGCRQNRDYIIAKIREKQGRFGRWEKVRAALLAIATGLVFRINPFDPFPGIVDLAIRRAERHSAEGGSPKNLLST